MADAHYPTPGPARPLVYAHCGDLHITDAKARNYRDFLAMLVQLQVEGAGLLDFVYLLGDVADAARARGAGSIGAWEENGILGTQLGPNRNAQPLHPNSWVTFQILSFYYLRRSIFADDNEFDLDYFGAFHRAGYHSPL